MVGLAFHNFGSAATGAGDINGDGYGDIVVGAPNAANGGLSNAGLVSVYFGRATGPSSTAQAVIGGAAMGDEL